MKKPPAPKCAGAFLTAWGLGELDVRHFLYNFLKLASVIVEGIVGVKSPVLERVVDRAFTENNKAT